MKINFRFDDKDSKEHGMDKESSKQMQKLGQDFFDKIIFAMGIELGKPATPETLVKSIAVLTFVENIKEITSLMKINECIILLDIVSDSMKEVVRLYDDQKERQKKDGNGENDSEEKSDASTFSTH